jgi:hypothetical protein
VVGTFNPSNPSAGYIADAGASNTSDTFSFNVTAGTPFPLAVTQAGTIGVGLPYGITITGLCVASCSSISITETLDATPPATNPDYTAATVVATGRMFRNNVPSTCAVPKTNPGNFGSASVLVDTYVFTPTQSSCVTITATQPSGANLFASVVGTFNPSNPSANYIADAGASNTSDTFSFDVTAGTPFTLAVTQAGTIGVGLPYGITITGLCAAGSPTNVNNQVNFQTTQQNLGGVAPAACTTLGYNNTQYNLNVTLTNIGTNTFTNPYYQVVELREAGGVAPGLPFRLRTADDFNAATCTGGLVGATQAITVSMPPLDARATSFQIVLPSIRRFRFVVNVFAAIGGGNTRNNRTVKMGQLAVEATGFDTAGNPILSSVFTPENGVPSFAVNRVSATVVR